MDAQQVKGFIDAMAASDLTELDVAKDGWTLRLVRGAARAPSSVQRGAAAGAASVAASVAGSSEQHAELSGVVFLQPGPGEPPFVQPGQAVKAGQTLCVIEAMKIFNEVHAERDGIVDAFLVASGQEVDAGQPLVRWR